LKEKSEYPHCRVATEQLLRHDALERISDGVQFQVPLVGRWVRERAPVE
jgi:hypothetical protein